MPYVVNGLVPWMFRPNTRAGVTETLAFNTRVSPMTYAGLRQKQKMLLSPRRSFSFQATGFDSSFRYMQNLLFGQGKRTWLLPVWPDRQSLESPAAAGSTSVSCATSGYDFGRYALLCDASLNTERFEVVEIDAVEPTHIGLVTATEFDWPEGAYLYPLRTAELNAFPALNARVSRVGTIDVQFDIVEPADYPALDLPDSYLGRPVWELKPEWRVSSSRSFGRSITTEDTGFSIPEHFDLPDKVFFTGSVLHEVHGRAASNQLRSYLYGLAGRFKTIWLPSFLRDVELVSATSGSVLTVQKNGYRVFVNGAENRRDIRIELSNGTRIYRRVISSAEQTDTETLSLNAPLGTSVSPDNVVSISFMSLGQQSADSSELVHLSCPDGAVSCALAFEGVVEPPSE